MPELDSGMYTSSTYIATDGSSPGVEFGLPTPRMKGMVPFDCRLNTAPGTASPRAKALTMPTFSAVSAVIAVTAIGTCCWFSARRLAVTVISDSWSSVVAAAEEGGGGG